MGNCIISKASNFKKHDFDISNYIGAYNNRWSILETPTTEIFYESLYHAQFFAATAKTVSDSETSVFSWVPSNGPAFFRGDWSGSTFADSTSWLSYRSKSDGIIRSAGQSLPANYVAMFDLWWTL